MSEETLFIEALEIPDLADRAAFLDRACGADAALRARLDRLLAEHEQAGGFLGRPAVGPATGSLPAVGGEPTATALPAGPGEVLGATVGPYKLLEVIGEGGMGTVYLARQTEPVKRLVALKVIKAGMDSAQVLARFAAERQALALMDHPNIAKVHDAGESSDGRPFFVMELVKGVPITKFCDDHRLTPRQRLELFVPVCQAVQHAHQKGVIHRDLKPSNVLVALYDDRPVPKVIDFGVAKATGQALTEKTLHTGFGAVVGTVEYMSPEQATFNQLDVDTRSDVYSLGVMLYELLAGSPPFSKKELEAAGMLEMLRVIREQEPSKPSTKLNTAAGLPTLAANRGTEPARLTRMVRGELDWIVMKCLEKDRNRRYESANGLAMDVQRYLADEAVQACPPSVSYRLRKFVRRNKGPALAATLVLSALVAGLAASTWLMVRARRAESDAVAGWNAEAERRREADDQRRIAIEAQQQASANEAVALGEKRKAEQSAAEVLSTFRFFESKVLAAARPKEVDGGLGINATVREAVDAAEPEVAGAFKDQPRVEAAVRNGLGITYLHLGEPELAGRQFERAVELCKAAYGVEHPETLTTLDNLASAHEEAGRLDTALSLHQEVLAARERTLGRNHPDTIVSANSVGVSFLHSGKPDRAVPLLKRALAGQEEKNGADDPKTLKTAFNLAGAYSDLGQRDLALPLYQRAVAGQKAKLGPNHRDTLETMNSLAVHYRDANQLDLAVATFEQVLAGMTAQFGPDHPNTLAIMDNLGQAHLVAGRYERARELFAQALEGFKKKRGADHFDTLVCMDNLSGAYLKLGKFDLALALEKDVLETRQRKLGRDHPETLRSVHNLATLYLATNKLDLAIPLCEQALAGRRAVLGAGHPDTLNSMYQLAQALESSGRAREAVPLLEDAVRGARKHMDLGHPRLQRFVDHLCDLYEELGLPSKAEPFLRDYAEFLKQAAGADSVQYARELAALGHNLLEQRKPDAEPVLRACLAIREKQIPSDWATFGARSMLGEALTLQKKYAEAEPLLVAGYEGMKKREAEIPAPIKVRRLTEALERLFQFYDAWAKPERAAEWRKKVEDIKREPNPAAEKKP